MAVRANISKGYIWRPGLIGIAALVFSAWFFYDGLVKYPRLMKMWDEYNQIVQDTPGDPVEQAKLWAEHAQQNGWPKETPKKKMEDKDILTQKVLGFITAPVGLYFLFTFVMSLGRWIEADEQGVRTRSGQETDYASIKSIDKSRWQSKGIAVVQYEKAGQPGRITLDDWKFEREPIKRILEAIEERMPGGGATDTETAPAEDTAG
ncbi:MAG: hypothetical protein R3C45_15805 [Phycisphaerales bacterium]